MAERQRDAKPARWAWLPGARTGVAVLLALGGGSGCQTAMPRSPSLPAQALGLVDEPVPGPKAAWDDLQTPGYRREAGRRVPTRPPAVVRPDELIAATAVASFAAPKSAGKTWNGWSLPATHAPEAAADARAVAALPRRDEAVAEVAVSSPVLIPEPTVVRPAPAPAPMPPVASADTPTAIPMPIPYVRLEPPAATPEPTPEPAVAVVPPSEVLPPVEPGPGLTAPLGVSTVTPAAPPVESAAPTVDDPLELPVVVAAVPEPTPAPPVEPPAEAAPASTPPATAGGPPPSVTTADVRLEAASQVSDIPMPHARQDALATPSLSSSDVSLEVGSQVADVPLPDVPLPDVPLPDAPSSPTRPTDVAVEAASQVSDIPMPGATSPVESMPAAGHVDVAAQAASQASNIPMPNARPTNAIGLGVGGLAEAPRPTSIPMPAAKPPAGSRPITQPPTPTPTVPTAAAGAGLPPLSVWRPSDVDSPDTTPRLSNRPVPNLLMPGP